jgi:prophage antirepressor-like protein
MDADKITPFLFEGETIVRIIDRDGQPWFVAADVCRALGLTNPTETVRGLDDDEKGLSITETLGGHQELVIVSESGLYTLIMRSRKPEAHRFRKWVTSVVLPTIRQTGAYGNSEWRGRARKPYEEWSLDEKRVALAQVRMAGEAWNQETAAWMWQHVGLPMPPENLRTPRQRSLF